MSDKSLFAQPLSVYEERNMKLVEALRSGKYKQGYDYLKVMGLAGGDRFCCLGVACLAQGMSVSDIEDHTTALPDHVRNWYGWSSVFGFPHQDKENGISNRITIDEDDYPSLVVVNDSKNVSFEQIADWLEKNWQLMLNPQAVKDM